MCENTLCFDCANNSIYDGKSNVLMAEFVNNHRNEREFYIQVNGISHEVAIQFALLYSHGRQIISYPIKNNSKEIVGWNLRFVDYSA
ncbi:MAG: hypothetical protein HFJ26_05590 [Clostridia bacterium]|nr:hypothetical protein [Clostridia bacterium]